MGPKKREAGWRVPAHALVVFAEDDELYHHRVIVRCDEGDKVWCVSPDREMYQTTLAEGKTFSEVIKWGGKKCPTGISSGECYLDKHSDYGVFTDKEIKDLVKAAKDNQWSGSDHKVRLKLAMKAETGKGSSKPKPKAKAKVVKKKKKDGDDGDDDGEDEEEDDDDELEDDADEEDAEDKVICECMVAQQVRSSSFRLPTMS